MPVEQVNSNGNGNGQDQGHQDVGLGHGKNLPKQKVFNTDRLPRVNVHADGENYQAQGEHGGEDHSDRGVVADACLAAEVTHQEGDGDAPGDGRYVGRKSQEGGDGDGGHQGVSQGIAHKGPTPGDDIGANHRQQESHQDRHNQGTEHERVLEGTDDVVNHFPVPER